MKTEIDIRHEKAMVKYEKLEEQLRLVKNANKNCEKYRDIILAKHEKNESENVELRVILTSIEDKIRHNGSDIRQLAREIKALKQNEEQILDGV